MLPTLLLSILSIVLAVPAAAYPIKANNVNCRAGPSTSSKVLRQYMAGHEVTLVCQTKGTIVNKNSLWDKTTDGCYVSDYYVKTGKDGYVTKACSGGGGGTTPPPSGSYCKIPNDAGIALIKEFEGFFPNIYKDPVGKNTVGYGHLCDPSSCSEVKYHIPLTEATATALLKDDLQTYTKCMANVLKVPLNDNQWAALTSFTFNLGCGAFSSSTLLRRLNAKENPNTVAAEELPKWVHAGSSVLPGLVRRRNAEIALFKKPSSKKGFPTCG